MATIKLEIVSPDCLVYEQDINMLIVRSTGGELGILPRHAPLVTGLVPHAMRVKLGGSTEQLIAVAGGFMEVTPEKITVLASAAEDPDHIDVNRAEQAYQRAKKRIEAYKQHAATADEPIDYHRAELALERAKARLTATHTNFENL
jgi:F-type H+-transporting ATPase subunit epsilon